MTAPAYPTKLDPVPDGYWPRLVGIVAQCWGCAARIHAGQYAYTEAAHPRAVGFTYCHRCVTARTTPTLF